MDKILKPTRFILFLLLFTVVFLPAKNVHATATANLISFDIGALYFTDGFGNIITPNTSTGPISGSVSASDGASDYLGLAYPNRTELANIEATSATLWVPIAIDASSTTEFAGESSTIEFMFMVEHDSNPADPDNQTSIWDVYETITLAENGASDNFNGLWEFDFQLFSDGIDQLHEITISNIFVDMFVNSVQAPEPPDDVIPEPSTSLLLIFGLLGFAGIQRRKA